MYAARHRESFANGVDLFEGSIASMRALCWIETEVGQCPDISVTLEVYFDVHSLYQHKTKGACDMLANGNLPSRYARDSTADRQGQCSLSPESSAALQTEATIIFSPGATGQRPLWRTRARGTTMQHGTQRYRTLRENPCSSSTDQWSSLTRI